MKAIKWIITIAALAVLTAVAVTGSLGDESADGKFLYIVQSELQRGADVLYQVDNDRKLLPGVYEELTKSETLLNCSFSITDKNENTVPVVISDSEEMYNAENSLDHIVVVTNTGNVDCYARSWFALEMGDLTEEEFKTLVFLNQNTTAWEWDDVEYGVEIDGERYAVVCAKYKTALSVGATTQPSLLQILLNKTATNETADRLDGNSDGKYEIKVYSCAVSDDGAWGAIEHPWSN